MSVPRFTAEASLYKHSTHYHTTKPLNVLSDSRPVLPQLRAAAGCGVSRGTLWCTNRVSPVYNKPSTNLPPSTQIDTLRTTYSYFLCWSEGQYHRGDNYTWYKTVGDDYGRTGWVPAYKLDTTSRFDSNPSNYGLSKCQYNFG